MEREPLQQCLQQWRSQVHLCNPLRAFAPASFILDDKVVLTLSKTRVDKLVSLSDLQNVLDETEEWIEEFGVQVLDIIRKFDREKLDIEVDSAEKPVRDDGDNGTDSESELEGPEGGEDGEDAGNDSAVTEGDSIVEPRKRLAVEEDCGSRKRARVCAAPNRLPCLVAGKV